METSDDRPKRIRYKIPNYKKVYSVYVYDREKYYRIYKKLHAVATERDENIYKRVNPYRVLQLCYVYKEGCLQRLGDERHIFRYKALDSVLSLIAQELISRYDISTEPAVLYYLYRRTGIALFSEGNEMQAEYMPASREGIGIRLKTNIELLRQLRAGAEIEDAIQKVKAKITDRTTFIK